MEEARGAVVGVAIHGLNGVVGEGGACSFFNRWIR